jgi:hypothetical protein
MISGLSRGRIDRDSASGETLIKIQEPRLVDALLAPAAPLLLPFV